MTDIFIGDINHRILVFFPIYLTPLKVIQNLKTLAVIGAGEFCDEKFYWRERKNGQIKGMISSSMLILFYTIQQGIPNICTKF